VHKRNRKLADLIATQINNFKAPEPWLTQVGDRSNPVHVEVQLLQRRHKLQEQWDLCELVSIQVQMCQRPQVYFLSV
jgi:hypothetical protein